MAVIYLPARYEDLAPALEVVSQGVNDLVGRHGFEGLTGAVTPEFHLFSLEEDPDGLWVAEDEGQVIGLGFSWVCGQFWFLADLFIRPEYQGQGVGGELMRRTLDHAQENDADNRALITFAYNRISIGLYVKHGLFPREPLYTVGITKEAIAGRVTEELAWTALDDSRSHAAALRRIDDARLGFSREKHHGYLFAEDAVTGVLFEDKGSPVGYAYVWSDEHIGPLAVTSQVTLGPAFNTALALAAHQGADQVSAFLPGSNESAMSIALDHGMRLGRGAHVGAAIRRLEQIHAQPSWFYVVTARHNRCILRLVPMCINFRSGSIPVIRRHRRERPLSGGNWSSKVGFPRRREGGGGGARATARLDARGRPTVSRFVRPRSGTFTGQHFG